MPVLGLDRQRRTQWEVLGRLFPGRCEMSRRVAFVHFPYSADSARMETMPFALQTVRALTAAGWQVDVFLWQKDINSLKGVESGIAYRQAAIVKLPLPRPLRKQVHALYCSLQGLGYALTRRYCCVIGLGQFGGIVGRAMALVSRCPLMYLNEELPSAWPQTLLTRLERVALRRADLLVSPDGTRNPQLLYELNLPPDTPTGVLYNLPVLEREPPAIDWHQRFGIPRDKQIVLHAGSVADWSQVPEVLATVPSWPQEVVLLLHSRSSSENRQYRRTLSHLDTPGRVYWSDEPLPEDELHSLIAASLACLGLYRVSSVNVELIGYSSGKIMRSLVCGTPVIASAIPSLDFVTEEGVGVQVRHPSEIAQWLPLLMAEREAYGRRCRTFTREQISFDKAWRSVCSQFAAITSLDLCQADGQGEGRAEG